jgi:light-regulated signal transduction histidine kinase (bacteriophytochrome)
MYEFDSRWNGYVVAELVDPRASADLYKGLHFPSSDIPTQARDLYKINRVRQLYDRDQVTSRLVCRTLEDLRMPLDMTHAYLRAMSPIHLKYLANMKIRSSMSISINCFDRLWGLVSCHSYGSKGMRIPFPIRNMCRLVGDIISRNVARLCDASHVKAQNLLNTLPTEINPYGYITASLHDLMQTFGADYVALSLCDETKIIGDNADLHEVLAISAFLRMQNMSSVIASHNISKDFSQLRYPPGLKVISGLLYMPLSTGASDFLVFFRKGHEAEIKWGGNPYSIRKKRQTIGYLEPRDSFTAWRETILGQSREWSNADLETATFVCFVCRRMIEARRHKESTMQRSQFIQLLLANPSQSYSTSLNAIIKDLEVSLDCTLDGETRETLTKSDPGTECLVHVINSLLDLTNSKKGQELIAFTMEGSIGINSCFSCSEFGLGIRAWCIHVVHEPIRKMRVDIQGFFFLQWQIFTLMGQPM